MLRRNTQAHTTHSTCSSVTRPPLQRACINTPRRATFFESHANILNLTPTHTTTHNTQYMLKRDAAAAAESLKHAPQAAASAAGTAAEIVGGVAEHMATRTSEVGVRVLVCASFLYCCCVCCYGCIGEFVAWRSCTCCGAS